MQTIFHNDQVWDSFDEPALSRIPKKDIPLYAVGHREDNDTWWVWYHSWSRVQIEQVNITPVIRTYLLLLERTL